MKNFLKNLLICLSLLAAGSMIAPQAFGAFYPTGGGTYRLYSSVGLSDTTIRLSSFAEPVSGMPYTMSYLNSSIEYGTLDPQNPTRQEFISFTGITQNPDGSATLTGVTRGLSPSYPYSSSSTLSLAHAGQAIFILSNTPQFYQQYPSVSNNSVVTGSWTFPTPTLAGNPVTLGFATSSYVDFTSSQTITGSKYFATSSTVTFAVPPTSGTVPGAQNQLANKAYVDSVAIAGAPNASTTAKGIVQEASSSDLLSGTSTGSTGARLYVNPASLVSTFAIPVSFSSVASSTWSGATTTLFTVTSTTTTQRVTVWAKGDAQVGSSLGTVTLQFATSTGFTILDTTNLGAASNNGYYPFSVLASFVPTATGTVRIIGTGQLIPPENLNSVTEVTTK